MERKLPKHCEELFDIAVEQNLSCPLGRALALCNRIQWGWSNWKAGYSYQFNQASREEIVRRMKSLQEETAYRWLDHWNSGGSIKNLALTQEEFNARKREWRKARKPFYDSKGMYVQHSA